MQMVQLSATRCSCIATLWDSIVIFVAITLCVASQRVFIVVNVYFVINSVRKLLDTPSSLTRIPPKHKSLALFKRLHIIVSTYIFIGRSIRTQDGVTQSSNSGRKLICMFRRLMRQNLFVFRFLRTLRQNVRI
jgi:hypothetical protein